MNKRALPSNKWLLLGLGCFLLCLIPAAILACGLLVWNLFALPQYSMEQVPSAHTGYLRTTLTSGNTVYVLDYEEYALLSSNTQPSQKIGDLPVTEGSTSGVYAIPGQDPLAYVLEYDPMYQAVYRYIEHPAFDWRTAPFQKIRLMLPSSPIETTDALIIQEIVTALKDAASLTVPVQASGNYSGYDNYSLLLFSDQLPGLMYAVGVHVDTATQVVYIGENYISGEWHLAGPLFIDWLNPP